MPYAKIDTIPPDGLDRSPLQIGDYVGATNVAANKPLSVPAPAPAPSPNVRAPAPIPAPVPPVPTPNVTTGLQGITGPPSLHSILGDAANQQHLQSELRQTQEELTRLKSMLPDVSPLRPEGGSVHALETIQPNPTSRSFLNRFGPTTMGLKDNTELRNHFGSRAFSGDPHWDKMLGGPIKPNASSTLGGSGGDGGDAMQLNDH